MKKNEFLEKLLAALEPLSEDERKQILDYCEELFCDGLEQGLSEEECVARFGSPEEAAAQFREEYSAQPSGSAPQRRRGFPHPGPPRRLRPPGGGAPAGGGLPHCVRPGPRAGCH